MGLKAVKWLNNWKSWKTNRKPHQFSQLLS